MIQHTIHLISILLPVSNEEKYIRVCLTQVFDQKDVPIPYEVIVADGMSTDSTRVIIQEIQLGHPNLLLIDNPGKIVPIGLNLALQRAKGDIVIRVDGHCEIALDYVSKCMQHLVSEEIDGVGGPMSTIGETPMSRTIALATSLQFGVGDSAFRTTIGKSILVDTVPFPAYTREIIEQVGLYDEELIRNQDDDYNYRIRAAGGKLLLAKDVKSRYYSRGSIGKLWNQYFQYGYWKVRVLQKSPRQMSMRQFIPPLFVSAILASILIAQKYQLGWVALAIITGAYILTNLIVSLITSVKNGLGHLLYLPLAFSTIHVSYGLGFLLGLLKFWNRWGDKQGRVPEFVYHDRNSSININCK
jgi:succinoglycan biosynthesis protein ExoA